MGKIENENQRRITENWIKKFKKALDIHENKGEPQNRLEQALRDSLQSQIETLEEELTEYRALTQGQDPIT